MHIFEKEYHFLSFYAHIHECAVPVHSMNKLYLERSRRLGGGGGYLSSGGESDCSVFH